MASKSKRKGLRDPQNIIAVGVTLISVCALIVSILQTRIMSEQRVLMHEQAKAAVWPRLSFEIGKSHEKENYKLVGYSLHISNDGVGPALVTDVRISYKGKAVKTWWHLFREFDLDDSIETYIGNATLNQRIFKPGERVRILHLSDNLPLAQVYYDQSEHIKYEIVYQSIYGDKWQFTQSVDGPKTEELDTTVEVADEEQFAY